MFGFQGITEDFNTAKNLFEGAKGKVSQFIASPNTTAKYKDLEARKVQIMISGGPEGGQVDDNTITKWNSEAKAVVRDIDSLYKTYVVPRNIPTTKASGSFGPTPASLMESETIFGINKYIVYGLGGITLAALITLLMPKKSSATAV